MCTIINTDKALVHSLIAYDPLYKYRISTNAFLQVFFGTFITSSCGTYKIRLVEKIEHKAHPPINYAQQIIIPTLPQQVIYHTAGDAITCY